MRLEHTTRKPVHRPLAIALAAALVLTVPPAPAARFVDLGIGWARLDPGVRSKTSNVRRSSDARYNTSRAEALAPVAVTNCDDDGPGSLRDAIAHAGAGQLVDLTHLSCATITLTSGAIVATGGVSIAGPARELLAIDGGGKDRVLTLDGGLFIDGLTIRNGAADGDGGCISSNGDVVLYEVALDSCSATGNGGAVSASGDLRVSRSTVTNNHAGAATPGGGGAFVANTVTILRSTLSGNDAPSGAGGAILTHAGHPPNFYRNLYESTLSGNHALVGGAVFSLANSFYEFEIMASTLSGNTAERGGGIASTAGLYISASTIAYNEETGGAAGGIYLYPAATALLLSSIVSGNLSGGLPLDIAGGAGAHLLGDHDLIGETPFPPLYASISGNPMLGPLADNGGLTATHALLPGSPAIHAGDYSFVSYDQRGPGYTRRVGGAFDIGAFTVQSTGVVRTVENCSDEGPGSLRDTIAASVSGDTIDLRSLQCGTIALTSKGLGRNINGNLTLIGPGRDALTIDGGGTLTPIYGAVRGRLTINGLTFANGLGVNGGCVSSYGTVVLDDAAVRSCTSTYLGGGGVLADRVFLTRSIVAGNTATATVRRADGGGIYALSELEMHDSTVSDNRAAGAYDYSLGGGIVVTGTQRVLIEGSTISGNSTGDDDAGITGYGAGIGLRSNAGYSSRHVVIRNSTVSGNHAVSAVGGISSESSLRLINSTVAFNTAGSAGDAGNLGAGVNMIFRYYSGALDLDSSIVAGNSAREPADVGGSAATVFGSHDLVEAALIAVPADTLMADPLLAALADNGGPTATHALLPGSPALDAGANPAGLVNDQRGEGFARVVGTAADIGAYEARPDSIFADGFEG